MANIVVKVPDNQVSSFMDLLKKLGYSTDAAIPSIEQWQIDIVEERMHEYRKNPHPLDDANEWLDDVIKKL